MNNYEFSMKCLQEMARITKADITPFTLALYEESLQCHGWDRVSQALKIMFKKLRRFPTIEDIEQEMGIKQPDQKDEANLIAARILQAASKFGEYRAPEAEDWLGSLGWEVVKKMGGWSQICMSTDDEQGTLRAQMRDLAKSVGAYASIGALDQRMELPESASEALKIMASKIV